MFTEKNTENATHYSCGLFYIYDEKGRGYDYRHNESRSWEKNRGTPCPNSLIDLTDQSGRGYPTLAWFLKKDGRLLEIGDGCNNYVVNEDTLDHCNEKCENDSGIYLKSTHDNRHDLTAMARDEYMHNKMTKWVDDVARNGNDGERYDVEPELAAYMSEPKPIYTQAMCDAGELPLGGTQCLLLNTCDAHPSYKVTEIGYVGESLAVYNYMDCPERCDNIRNLKFKPIKTDADKLRDAMYVIIKGECQTVNDHNITQSINYLLASPLLKITLNEGK